MVDQAPETGPAARAVGTLLAPVVACLRGDDEGYVVLLDGALDDGAVRPAVRAAPAVARVYLRLAPEPDGSGQILRTFVDAARERFETGAVALGAECLAVAQAAPDQLGEALASVTATVFPHAALEHGERFAFGGAVASGGWAAFESARLRDVD